MSPSSKTFQMYAFMLALSVWAGSPGARAQGQPAPPAAEAAEATNETTNAAAPAAPPAPEAPEMPWQPRGNHPVLFSDFVLEKGKTNFGDAVVINGSSTINGVLERDAVTIFGDVKVNGTVSRDLVVVMGNAELGPEATVKRNVVVIGGTLRRDPGATIGREVVDTGKIPGFRPALAWVTQGLLLGRPLPFRVGWAWIVAGLFLLLNLVLQLIFPRPIEVCVETMGQRPVSSFFAGILAKLLFGLLITLLAISVIGLVAAPFLVAAFVGAFLFGKITMYRYAGQQLGRQLGLEFVQAPAVALIVGTAIFYLLYAVPFLGFVAWAFTGILGVGAVSLAAVQKFRAERPKAVSPVSPPVAAAMPESQLAGAAPLSGPAPEVSPSPTPSAVMAATPLEVSTLPRAGFWIRLFATLLDAIVVLIPLVLFAPRFHPEPFLLLWLAYHVVLWTWKGTTIGGIIMGIKVTRVDGRPLDFAVALIRALASVLSAFVLGLGFFWAGISPEKQSWHDKVAGTIVVKVPKSMSLI